MISRLWYRLYFLVYNNLKQQDNHNLYLYYPQYANNRYYDLYHVIAVLIYQ